MVWILMAFVLGCGSMAVVGRWFERRQKKEGHSPDRERVEVSLQNMIQLANINTAMDAGYLLLEYKLNLKIPEFYDRYIGLIKQQRELYFKELMDVFGRHKSEYVRELLDKYTGFSGQDVLLLLMCEMQLDNKTMAQIMGLSLETLKKRKTRMRMKMRMASSATL